MKTTNSLKRKRSKFCWCNIAGHQEWQPGYSTIKLNKTKYRKACSLQRGLAALREFCQMTMMNCGPNFCFSEKHWGWRNGLGTETSFLHHQHFCCFRFRCMWQIPDCRPQEQFDLKQIQTSKFTISKHSMIIVSKTIGIQWPTYRRNRHWAGTYLTVSHSRKETIAYCKWAKYWCILLKCILHFTLSCPVLGETNHKTWPSFTWGQHS